MSKAKNTNTAISTKEANAKIENNQQLTKEEIATLQEDAQKRTIKFTDELKKKEAKNYSIKVNSDNEITLTDKEKFSIKFCRKEKFTTCYHVVSSNELRNKMLNTYKYNKEVTKTTNKKYLDSKVNKEFYVVLNSNVVDKEFLEKVEEIFKEMKRTQEEAKKELKKAK